MRENFLRRKLKRKKSLKLFFTKTNLPDKLSLVHIQGCTKHGLRGLGGSQGGGGILTKDCIEKTPFKFFFS